MADADSPSTAMHITTNRLHSAAFAAIAAIAAAANFVSVLQSNEAEFQRAAAAFFTVGDFSPSPSVGRSVAMRAKDNGGSFRRLFAPFRRFSPPPSLLVYQSACSVRGPSQMKSVDQMAADGCGGRAVQCAEVVVHCTGGVSGRIYSDNAIDLPLRMKLP